MFPRLPTAPAFAVAALAAVAAAGYTPEEPRFPPVLAASDAEVKKITEAVEKAEAAKDTDALATQVREMETLKSDAFVPIIHRAMKSDSNDVLAAAMRAAGAHELKDEEKNVRRVLHAKSKSKKDDKLNSRLASAAIDYLCRLGLAGEEATVQDELIPALLDDESRLKAASATDLMRAGIRYLGKMKCKHAVPFLVAMLARPESNFAPGDKRAPSESYWKARVLLWQKCESWVRWALKEITGQEFREFREWDAWVKQNKKDFK